MKTEIAIVAPAPDDDETIEEIRDLNDALTASEENSRDADQEMLRRLLDLGSRLNAEKATRVHGTWESFLERCGVTSRRASDARKYASFVKSAPGADLDADLPTRSEAGIDHHRPTKKRKEEHDDSGEPAEPSSEFHLAIAAGKLKTSVWKFIGDWPMDSIKTAVPAVLRQMADEIENGHR